MFGVLGFALFMTTLTGCKPNDDILTDGASPPQPAEVVLSPDMDSTEYLRYLDLAWQAVGETHGASGKVNGISRNFNLTYSPTVTINVGGVAYSRPTSEWLSGASAGSVAIPPAVFAAVQGSASKLVRLEVFDSWFFLQPVRITLLDKGGFQAEGLYNRDTGEFLFLGVGGSAGGTVGNTSCGAVSLATLYGRVTPDWLKLNNGQYTVGFVAACDAPVLVVASATFPFTGLRAL